jgi:hypothetical protein
MTVVTMTCMTTKQKFEVEDPEVVVLANGRFAYRAECPWTGKGEKTLTAYKFCSRADHEAYTQKQKSESEHSDPGEEEAAEP